MALLLALRYAGENSGVPFTSASPRTNTGMKMGNTDPEIVLESVDEVPLEQHFDRVKEVWNKPFDGPLWSVVAYSHEQGQKGQGRRIAIVDSGFDMGIGRVEDAALGSCVQESPQADSKGHGTYVALLINEIAPEATLDLYEVSLGGRPNRGLLGKALGEIGRSEADIVNLSLGHRPVSEGENACNCSVATAVAQLAASGKTVVAACGNQEGPISCPAALDSVLAVGYRGELREIEWQNGVPTRETAMAVPPDFEQTMAADVVVQQPPDVLGSSFAVPMVSGLAALSPPLALEDLATIRGIVRAAVDASDVTALNTLELLERYPWESPVQALERLGIRSSNPLLVWMTVWIYINYAHYLMLKDLSIALSYAEKATDLAPWDENAWSMVAGTHMHMAQEPHRSSPDRREHIRRAVDAYDNALAIRKDHIVYRYWRERCLELAGQLQS